MLMPCLVWTFRIVEILFQLAIIDWRKSPITSTTARDIWGWPNRVASLLEFRAAGFGAGGIFMADSAFEASNNDFQPLRLGPFVRPVTGRCAIHIQPMVSSSSFSFRSAHRAS